MDNRPVIKNKKTNLLELEEHIYHLVDVDKPNVYHNLFPYVEVPKIAFNDRIVPHNMPEKHMDYRYNIQRRTAVKNPIYNRADSYNL